ncbi:MAG: carboxypeptidase regulatory-like domain-containing protein [Chloroflexi bacterium]|nr:carboxypeptidase regulatory-like domain-containing protein [Chloroflexota bacterium]
MAKTQNFILRLLFILAVCAFIWILSPIAYPVHSAGGTEPPGAFILSGAIRGESGGPPLQEYVAVKLYPGLKNGKITTEGEYRYLFSSDEHELTAGRYVIAVTHESYSFAPQEVTLEGDQLDVDITGVYVENGEEIPPEIQVDPDPVIKAIDASSKEVVFTVSLNNQGNRQIIIPVWAIEHDLAFAAPSPADGKITFDVGESAKQFSVTVKRSRPDQEEQHTLLFFVGQDGDAVVKIAQGVGVATVHFDAPDPTATPDSPRRKSIFCPYWRINSLKQSLNKHLELSTL